MATDLPNSTHYLTDARCGLLGQPENPDSLAQAVCYLLDHPQEAHEMRMRGRKAFEQKYNWESQDGIYARFYSKIISEKQ